MKTKSDFQEITVNGLTLTSDLQYAIWVLRGDPARCYAANLDDVEEILCEKDNFDEAADTLEKMQSVIAARRLMTCLSAVVGDD